MANRLLKLPSSVAPGNLTAAPLSTLNLKPAILNPQTSNLNNQHSTLNTQHSTLNTQHSTLNTHSSTLNTQHSTLNLQPSTLNPQPSTLNPQLSTLNPQPTTPQSRDQGDYGKALEHYKLGLAIKIKAMGYYHADVARTFNAIGVGPTP